MENLVAGGLAALCVLMVLQPFAGTRHHVLALPDADPDRDHGEELLRQLRDLDEDLAAGKLDENDHRRLRGPVEREAAQVLRRAENRRAEKRGAEDRPAEDRPAGSPPPVEVPGGHRRRGVWVALPAGVFAVASVLVLLSGALTPRGTGQTITGGAATVSPPQTSGPTTGPGKDAQSSPAQPPAVQPPAVQPPAVQPPAVQPPGPPGAAQPPPVQPPAAPPNAAQLAAVEVALARVRTSPKDVGAHLDLARAYAGAGASQLSAIEYLAVIQLDPGNASANTQLALVAFAAGQAAQAKKLVDAALSAHPGYPEALYARGVIQLMGLGDPAAARRDLRAYLAAAPRGSHRTSAETLLAITSGSAR